MQSGSARCRRRRTSTRSSARFSVLTRTSSRHLLACRRPIVRSASTSLLPRIQELRKKTGHPHWTVLDEAHHLLPCRLTRAPRRCLLRPRWSNLAMVTVAPDLISPLALDQIEVFIAVGEVTEALASILNRRGLHASPRRSSREWRDVARERPGRPGVVYREGARRRAPAGLSTGSSDERIVSSSSATLIGSSPRFRCRHPASSWRLSPFFVTDSTSSPSTSTRAPQDECHA